MLNLFECGMGVIVTGSMACCPVPRGDPCIMETIVSPFSLARAATVLFKMGVILENPPVGI